jgi:hypothetical protein
MSRCPAHCMHLGTDDIFCPFCDPVIIGHKDAKNVSVLQKRICDSCCSATSVGIFQTFDDDRGAYALAAHYEPTVDLVETEVLNQRLVVPASHGPGCHQDAATGVVSVAWVL